VLKASDRTPLAARNERVTGHARALGRASSATRFVLCVLASCVALSACRRPSGPERQGESAPIAAPHDGLPPLALDDTTQGMLLTWADEQGDFHVAEGIEQVPAERREKVRVVLRDRSDGTGELVYVADLRAKQDGHYAVSVVSRAEWEEVGAAKRAVRMEGVAPGAKPAEAPAIVPPADGSFAPNGAITAIIYGADWCKPCHDAERYLKGLGVQVTKKNIEQSQAAQAEMQAKLARIKRSGASIPVIDVMGQLFVGYNPNVLKQAVEAARHQAP
jgi:glutaredoxin